MTAGPTDPTTRQRTVPTAREVQAVVEGEPERRSPFTDRQRGVLFVVSIGFAIELALAGALLVVDGAGLAPQPMPGSWVALIVVNALLALGGLLASSWGARDR